jgi:ABC-2 type transport system ATP-binding protein
MLKSQNTNELFMTKLISIKNLSYTVPYGDTILKDVNLEVAAGEFIGILGHNGSGKTTLLDIILGSKRPSLGQVNVLAENPHAVNRIRKNEIVFLSQDVSIKGDLRIKDFLKFHSAFYPNYSKEEAERLLEVFELNEDMKVGALSTGQQKKVQVVANFATAPKLIIIDEITAVMDPETRDTFFKELLALKIEKNTSVLLATNLAEDLIRRADRVLFIENQNASLHSPDTILNLFNIEKAA